MKRTPIKKRSPNKIMRDRLYYKLKKEYFEDHPTCEVCQRNPSCDIHHRKGQGIYQNEVKFFMAICRLCHSKIELNRKWAYGMGYLLDRIGHD